VKKKKKKKNSVAHYSSESQSSHLGPPLSSYCCTGSFTRVGTEEIICDGDFSRTKARRRWERVQGASRGSCAHAGARSLPRDGPRRRGCTSSGTAAAATHDTTVPVDKRINCQAGELHSIKGNTKQGRRGREGSWWRLATCKASSAAMAADRGGNRAPGRARRSEAVRASSRGA
jgi:hypothetical protein